MRTDEVYKAQIAPKLKQEGDCLIFTGSLRNGYGAIKVGGRRGKVVYTHRIVYETFVGELQDGLFVLHRCNRPACCNPEHLGLGTQGMNMSYAKALGRTVGRTDNPLSQAGVRGICAVQQSGKTYYRAYTPKPNRQNLYWGQDFFQAVCARKSWETKQNPLTKGA